MKKLKKFLYLLQLEEYDGQRFLAWLSKFPIEKLKEKKKRLKWTARVILTFVFCLPLSLFLSQEKAVFLTNKLVGFLFFLLTKITVFLAKIKLAFYPSLTKIIITGSYGKTTFKEMLAFILADKVRVLKTPENINNLLPIALLILKRLKKEHQVLIVEAGAYKKGEIKSVCRLIKPDFGVITIIGFMHLERFKTVDNIRKIKTELIPFIKNKNRLFYPPKNHQFIDFEKTILEIGKILGLKKDAVRNRLKKFSPPEYRLVVKKINSKITLLDNSYSSNPKGFDQSLKKLASFVGFQKIVITPGMIELGVKQFFLNQKLARKATGVADIFVVVGKTNRKALVSGAKNKTKIIFTKPNEDWQEKIIPFLKPPTVILLENDLPDHYF